ncbi:MAG: Hsp20/alpha crystallin family protein [Deltaproteobacteria bacterium]|nr:Hsp20/alpha crystallin family protein [Kofleriaceae bacterium]
MADIMRRGEYPMVEWDPMRIMREMLRWDPFRELGGPIARGRETWMPCFEVRENGDAFRFIADLPGVKRDDIEITVHGNRLQIAGRREAEKETSDENVYAFERSFGQFARAFSLPENADTEHIKTELRDGVLTIVVPKTEGAKPKKIAIGSGASKD